MAVHAEANALLYCDRQDLIGATLYITRAPCMDCSKLIAAAGIVNVIWFQSALPLDFCNRGPCCLGLNHDGKCTL